MSDRHDFVWSLCGGNTRDRGERGRTSMQPEVERWFADRSWQAPRWSIRELVEAKGGRTVSVVLPALNEQQTVGEIVSAIRPLTDSAYVPPLVDDLVVLDSGSTDRTVDVARGAGARVVRYQDVLPTFTYRTGKGEVLWRSLAATSSDLLVFVDSDLVDFDASFVCALLGPLLTRSEPNLVKGFYRRPLRVQEDGAHSETGGGRVTELLARPVLSALRPELSAVVQPLGGEYAARRGFLESVPFAPGYGVEIGLLLDAHRCYGLDGLAQVNLGVRKHRHRELWELGVMSRQVLAAVLARCPPRPETDRAVTSEVPFAQFFQAGEEWSPHEHDVVITDRPPFREVPRSVRC